MEIDWGQLVFGSQNNTPDVTNGVNNAVSCNTEAVQFSASFVVTVCQLLMKFVEWKSILYFFPSR